MLNLKTIINTKTRATILASILLTSLAGSVTGYAIFRTQDKQQEVVAIVSESPSKPEVAGANTEEIAEHMSEDKSENKFQTDKATTTPQPTSSTTSKPSPTPTTQATQIPSETNNNAVQTNTPTPTATPAPTQLSTPTPSPTTVPTDSPTPTPTPIVTEELKAGYSLEWLEGTKFNIIVTANKNLSNCHFDVSGKSIGISGSRTPSGNTCSQNETDLQTKDISVSIVVTAESGETINL